MRTASVRSPPTYGDIRRAQAPSIRSESKRRVPECRKTPSAEPAISDRSHPGSTIRPISRRICVALPNYRLVRLNFITGIVAFFGGGTHVGVLATLLNGSGSRFPSAWALEDGTPGPES